MEIKLLSKEYENKWIEYVNMHPASEMYHTLIWRDTINKSYGYEPKYYIALDNNKVVGILPLFLIKKIWGNKRISSGPFAYHSPLLVDTNQATEALILNAIKEGTRLKARYVELRPVKRINKEVLNKFKLIEVKPYKLTTLKLMDYGSLKMNFAAGLRRNLKRNQRKMENQNLRFCFENDKNDLEGLYDLILNEHKRKFGVPCGPYKMFKITHQLFKENHKVFTIKDKKGRIVAGIIFVFFNGNITPLYLMSHRAYDKLALQMLLIGKAIKWGCDNNLKSYSFGISSPSQKSLIFFKELWGSTTEDVYYYYRPISGEIPKNFDFDSSYSQLRKVYRFLPSSLIKFILPKIAKYLG